MQQLLERFSGFLGCRLANTWYAFLGKLPASRFIFLLGDSTASLMEVY
jgi:hypothetical protein